MDYETLRSDIDPTTLRDPEGLPALDDAIFAGYVAGLRHDGAPFWCAVGDHALTTWFEQSFGHPYPDILDRGARIVRFLCDQADEARELMSALEYPRVLERR